MRATYILSLSIHQFIYTLKDYLFNFHFLCQALYQVLRIQWQMWQLTVYGGSLAHKRGFNDGMWTRTKQFACAKADGGTEKEALPLEWVEGCKKPFGANVWAQSWWMSMESAGELGEEGVFQAAERAWGLIDNGRWERKEIAEVTKEVSLIICLLHFHCVDVCWWRGCHEFLWTLYASEVAKKDTWEVGSQQKNIKEGVLSRY